ncbi:MAG TPA: hypothetical protein VN668_10620 [Stellaceae bacterium]|nr:hypothetical protein [Stellaceae bacterium]
MRLALPLLAAACATLAACAGSPQPVSSAPPSVSYRVPNNDAAATSAEAQNYCAQYGHAAQYRGTEAAPEGEVAVYTCDGVPQGTVGSTVPPAEGSSVPPGALAPGVATPCADALHQDRPGGADYHGPPVAGCPATR